MFKQDSTEALQLALGWGSEVRPAFRAVPLGGPSQTYVPISLTKPLPSRIECPVAEERWPWMSTSSGSSGRRSLAFTSAFGAFCAEECILQAHATSS